MQLDSNLSRAEWSRIDPPSSALYSQHFPWRFRIRLLLAVSTSCRVGNLKGVRLIVQDVKYNDDLQFSGFEVITKCQRTIEASEYIN